MRQRKPNDDTWIEWNKQRVELESHRSQHGNRSQFTSIQIHIFRNHPQKGDLIVLFIIDSNAISVMGLENHSYCISVATIGQA